NTGCGVCLRHKTQVGCARARRKYPPLRWEHLSGVPNIRRRGWNGVEEHKTAAIRTPVGNDVRKGLGQIAASRVRESHCLSARPNPVEYDYSNGVSCWPTPRAGWIAWR